MYTPGRVKGIHIVALAPCLKPKPILLMPHYLSFNMPEAVFGASTRRCWSFRNFPTEGDSSEELQCNSPELITTAHCLVREGSHSVHSRFLFCKTVRLGFGRCATDVARHIYKVQRQWGLGSRQWLAGICFGRTYIAFDYWRSLPSARFFIAFTSPISADSCLQSYLL